MRKSIRLLSVLLLVVFAGCPGLPVPSGSKEETKLTLLFSGNTQGALEPCG